MATPDDFEAYLTRLDRRFEKVRDLSYVVSLGADRPPVAVTLAPPVVVAQLDIGPVPKGSAEMESKLFRRLLELNARDLLHVAYGIERDRIVLDAALDLDSLDLRELESVFANMDLAVAEHVPELYALAK